MSNNIFEIYDDRLSIGHKDWKFTASATIRDDYKNEIMEASWSKNGNYLYNSRLGYLHIYIMKKWYGNDQYQKMKDEGYVVDHMDNDGYNCCIDNLCFLASDENKAKGMTVDKLSKEKTHIALSLCKDFHTDLIQILIDFNYPAKAKISTLQRPAVIDLAYLLYDLEYEMVLNDARKILYDYRREYIFEPEKLHNIDYHIEGCYGEQGSLERYNRYIAGGHGYGVVYMIKSPLIKNWTLETKKEFLYLRDISTKR